MKRILVFVIVLFSALSSQAQQFSHISVNDGLSQSTVMSIAQDRLGRVWFATHDGLNVYDGYDFEVFMHEEGDSLSLSDNLVKKVFVDSAGDLWVGTSVGLSHMENSGTGFRNFDIGVPVIDMVEAHSGLMLLATGKGLKFFDTSKMDYLPVSNEILSSVYATSLCVGDDLIYIGTDDGSLFTFSKSGRDIRKISFSDISATVMDMTVVSDSLLWVATEGEGLYRIDLQNQRVRRWTRQADGLASDYVRSLMTDRDGRLWVGTFDGLNIFDGGKASLYRSNPFEPGTLSQNSVRAIFEDNQGGVWLGTYFGGLNYYHPLNNRFKLMTRLPKENSLNDNVIGSIVEDDDRTLWIGTNSGGVNHYIPSEKRFEHFKVGANDNGMESNDIKAIYIDRKADKVYVGAHAGGLMVLDRKTGMISPYGNGRERLKDVYSIVPRNARELWVGTLSGLYILDKVSGKSRTVTEDMDGNRLGVKLVKVLMEDSSGHLWVAGSEGVEVFALTDGGLRKSTVCKSGILNNIDNVNTIHESADKAVWIGTRNGLYRYMPSNTGLLHYTVADGLPNNIVNGIEEDASGRLWLSTDYGLCCFNPYAGTFRNFTIEDGLQGNQFNNYAHCCTKSGEMYFGGINGLTSFFPEQMEDNPYSPNPIISGLWMEAHKIEPGDGSGILDTDISMTGGIVLNPKQNTFSISYTVPNFLSGKRDSFAYRMEGFEKEWHYVEGKRNVTYSNLPAGRYVFQLKAANNDGVWNQTPTELEILIRPWWYKTVLAKIFFGLALVAAVLVAMRFFVERTKMKNRLILDAQEKEQQEELHQMKMRFFINVSHELRTPLTLILNPLQELITRENDTWKRKYLKYIEKNAQRLLHLVNQLMEYRRAELGVFKLRVRGENAHKIIRENWMFYEKLAQNRKIKYTLLSELEGKNIYVDGQYLELILNNLLSNAFKYTESGHIDVHAYLDGENMVLEVSDSGVGIAADKQEKIFERFYQVDDKHIGSGIGLSLVHRLVELHHGTVSIDSQEGVGSVFTITFPQNLSLYAEDELISGEATEGLKASIKEVFINDFDPEEEIDLSSTEETRGKLLVAEKNDEVRHYMRDVLSKMFEVKTVRNGQEALEYLNESPVDLVIADYVMPVMGGDKLCAHIKQNIATSHIPVIIVSARTDTKDQLEALKSGADAYIFKPFSMSVLIVRIQNMLRTSMRISDRASKSMDISPEKISFNAMDEQLLNRAIEVVGENLDNVDFSTEEFAQAMNMSRSNLHLKLKALTGESALDFIRKVRFKEACKLLKDGRYSIAEISDKVGFSTPSYFATSFKKHMGCLPTEYVKQHHNS